MNNGYATSAVRQSELRAQRTAAVRAAGAVAVVRVASGHDALAAADALVAGDVLAIELTLTTPGALEVLHELRQRTAQPLVLGAGSVLTVADAQAAIEAGATFLVSPIFDARILAMAHEADVPAMPGAYTPTELFAAYRSGADVVKLFPADGLGVKYLRGVLAPMPFLPIMPTGGVTPENVGEWLQAGAVAVGLGSSLVDPRLIASGNLTAVTERARLTSNAVAAARATTTEAT